MSDVINIDDYRNKTADSALNGIAEIGDGDKEEIDKIASSIAEKYIKRLNETDHSFSFQGDPTQAELVQDKINALRSDLNNIIVSLIQEVTEKSICVCFLEKYRQHTLPAERLSRQLKLALDR